MSKLLAVLIAGVFATVATTGFAQEKKADAPKAEMKKDNMKKADKPAKKAKKAKTLPRMLGFQAAGSAPIVLNKVVEDPHTLATAIKIGNPASWKQALAARDESKGLIEAVTDEEIIEAYKLLAIEGVFAEPASAASVAGIVKLNYQGFFNKSKKKTLVCTLTGHGLKDPNIAISNVAKPIVIKADLKAIIREIGL